MLSAMDGIWYSLLSLLPIFSSSQPSIAFLILLLLSFSLPYRQFFGTIFFCLFAFYLLLAVVKGNFKWGIRVPFFMTLHPMKKNGTMQNSILVNVVLILIASVRLNPSPPSFPFLPLPTPSFICSSPSLSQVAITQYLADSFSTYARATAINSIFNIAIKNLRGIYYYWLVVYWALPAIALLTCIFFAIRPADPQKRLMLEAQKGSA